MSIRSQIWTKLRNTIHRVVRPSNVVRAQHKHLEGNPTCAACGATTACQAHHIKPFNKFPHLASDPDNFITLCEHSGGPEHHLNLGHGGAFKYYNPNIVEDAQAMRSATTHAEKITILERAKANRQIDKK